MSQEQLSPESYLEQARAKSELYLKTGEIDSDIVANFGEVPNLEEIAAVTEGKEGRIDFTFSVEADGEITSAKQMADAEEEDIDIETTGQAFTPLLEMLAKDYRMRMGLGAVKLHGDTGGHIRTIQPTAEPGDVQRPHTDNDPAQPLKGLSYLVCLGPSTRVWKGRFDMRAVNAAEEHAAPGEYFADNEELERQIVANGAERLDVPDSSVLLLDSHAVHAAPTADPALVGQKRGIMIINFEPEAKA